PRLRLPPNPTAVPYTTLFRSQGGGGARRRRAPRRGHGAVRGVGPRGRRVHRALARDQAVHAPPGGAVHDVDPPAGGEPQAAHVVAAGDAHGAVAVRERLHHLHADGLAVALGRGHDGG